mmetsp:Transcript_16449/g.22961  ORF Transcript_16449/g.22961 Transcript_16449/m.22961 type:complete len:110 (-) Transcript_16449:157-486(-)
MGCCSFFIIQCSLSSVVTTRENTFAVHHSQQKGNPACEQQQIKCMRYTVPEKSKHCHARSTTTEQTIAHNGAAKNKATIGINPLDRSRFIIDESKRWSNEGPALDPVRL